MNYLKKIILLLAFLSLTFSIFFLQKTYAKYKTDVESTANLQVARWRIVVNNQDIRNNKETTVQITPTFTNNDNVKDNVIAPTSEGYFDIIIDCSAADVSFNYSINITTNPTSSVTDLIATGYSINNNDIIPIQNNTPITNNVLRTDNINIISIRVYIKWDDSQDATMDNIADTNATQTNNGLAKLDISLSFKQIA